MQCELEPGSPATFSELHQYLCIAETRLYLGQAVLSQACLVTSKLQQRLGMLAESDVMDSILMLRELKRLNPVLSFRRPSSTDKITICTLSDASQALSCESYGQMSVLSSLKIAAKIGKLYYHLILCSSHKQRKI